MEHHHASELEVVDEKCDDSNLKTQESAENPVKVETDQKCLELEFLKLESIEDDLLTIPDIKIVNLLELDDDIDQFDVVKVWKLVEQVKCRKCAQLFDTEDDYKLHFALDHSKTTKLSSRENYSTSSTNAIEEVFIDSSSQIHHFRQSFDVKNHEDSKLISVNKPRKKKIQKSSKQPEKLPTLLIRCDECGHIFGHKKEFFEHRMSHINMRFFYQKLDCGKCRKICECKICGELVARIKARFHNVHVHDEGEKLLRTCQACNLSFKLYDDFNDHVKRVHKGNNVCMICGESIESEFLMYTHRRLNHPTLDEPKKFFCDHCDYKSVAKHSLASHMTHHGFDFKTQEVVCEQCGKTYANNNALLTHVKISHTEKTSNPCSKCSKTFSTRKKLSSHYVTVHAEKSPCDQCGQMIALGPSMKLHMKKHRKKVESTCPICGIKKESAEKIKSHLSNKHSTRRYPCELGCEYAAARKEFLKWHYIAHKEISAETRASLIANIKNLEYYTVPQK